MNAENSLLDNFSRMKEEFSSSNNRMNRDINKLFENSLNDLESSLEYFNDEYEILSSAKLNEICNEFKKKINDIKVTHESKYLKRFNKEVELLRMSMGNFFKNKLIKGDNTKKKMSSEVKSIVDKICDYDVLGLEEDIDNFVYNFKVDFEMKYINNEYCKDDFNKVIRSFEHCLVSDVRNEVVSSIGEKQDIVSRYALSAYTIVDHYRSVQR